MDPENALIIEDVIVAISQRPRGAALLVVGNFNTNLAAPEVRERYEGIVVAMEEEGLEDTSGHFLPWYKPWLIAR